MTPIKIFGFAGSTYVRTARIVCAEKGVPHQLVAIEFGAESHAARHPFLKMPAMEHEGVRLFETLAIATYVDGLSGRSLRPVALRDQALMMQWISVAIDYVYDHLVSSLLADRLPEGAREKLSKTLDVLDEGLRSSEFFAGMELSLADLFLAPMVEFGAQRHTDWAMGKRNHLERWLSKMQCRSSLTETAQHAAVSK